MTPAGRPGAFLIHLIVVGQPGSRSALRRHQPEVALSRVAEHLPVRRPRRVVVIPETVATGGEPSRVLGSTQGRHEDPISFRNSPYEGDAAAIRRDGRILGV